MALHRLQNLLPRGDVGRLVNAFIFPLHPDTIRYLRDKRVEKVPTFWKDIETFSRYDLQTLDWICVSRMRNDMDLRASSWRRSMWRKEQRGRAVTTTLY